MNTDYEPPRREGAKARIRTYAVVSGGANSFHQQAAENSNNRLRTGTPAICLTGHSYASSSGFAPGHRDSHCSWPLSPMCRKMAGSAPTLIMYPAKRIRMPMAARLKSRRLRCGVAIRKTMPEYRCVVVKSFVDPIHFHQRRERQVNDIHFLRQVSWMKAVVGRPSDRPGAENVKWQNNQRRNQRDPDSPGHASFFHRWFHASAWNITSNEIRVNSIWLIRDK